MECIIFRYQARSWDGGWIWASWWWVYVTIEELHRDNATIENLHGGRRIGGWLGCQLHRDSQPRTSRGYSLDTPFETMDGDIEIWNLNILSSFPPWFLVNISTSKLDYGLKLLVMIEIFHNEEKC